MTNQEKLDLVAEKVSQCKLCPVLVENRTQTVFGDGNPEADIVLIGEAAGKNEDEQGIPFVGRAGDLLNNILMACKLEREKDVYICNIVKCRPPSNRNPLDWEAKNCRPFLDLQLKVIAPKVIVCMGAVASNNLLGNTDPIGMLRGRWHEYRSIPVVCTYHPAYLLRSPAKKKDAWEDWEMLMTQLQSCSERK